MRPLDDWLLRPALFASLFLFVNWPWLASADLPKAATDLDLKAGFQAELLYTVPPAQGSWVSMTFDPQGRIIASHEGGGLYRVSPSPIGQPKVATVVTKLRIRIGGAQGLLYAFDSLYAVSQGLLRLRDTTGDGQFDATEKLLTINGRGEHGPHAVVLGPRKQWLYVVAGNGTRLPLEFSKDRVAALPGAKSHSPPGPQGFVMRVTPDGKRRELYSVGLRNSYGLAFHPDGELFTFDSDNEGFMGLPWYRPTNLFHVVSGADFGWRQGPATLQRYHPDNLPPILEVGPGSPTGMTFGTAAKFPDKYQRALFLADWSYGRIYAIHLTPRGASYSARQEFFLSGRPLAVTDLRIGPDGGMYFLTGGRGTSSRLYRVTWRGPAADSRPPPANHNSADARSLRREFESFHGQPAAKAIDKAWRGLALERSLRYAARTAIEHQHVALWQDRALAENDTVALLEAMMALARQGDQSVRDKMIARLSGLNWQDLRRDQRLALLRIYEVVFQRLGIPSRATADSIRLQIDSRYPNVDGDLNRELIKLLIDLRSTGLVERTLTVLEKTPTAMRQIHFLLQLNRLGVTWNADRKKRLLACLDLEAIRDTGARRYKDVSATIKKLLDDLGVSSKPDADPPPRKHVHNWTPDDLTELVTSGGLRNSDRANGQTIFRQARCHACHRIGNTGGVLGPNLTGLAGRFRPKEVLEAVLEPDKVISDQYRTTLFLKKDGKQFSGQIVNLSRGVIQVRLDPFRPFPRVSFRESEIEAMRLSNVSLMPKGLLNSLTKKEIRDLLGYLLEARR